jgi:hypothetical protein
MRGRQPASLSSLLRRPALLAVVPVLLSACGGSAHTTPHFVAVANAICLNTAQELDSSEGRGTSLGALASSAAAEVPIVSGEVSQLAALTPPAGERAMFATALSATRRQIAVIKLLIGAVRAGNHDRIVSLALQDRTIDAAAKTATADLGLTACARGGPAARRP